MLHPIHFFLATFFSPLSALSASLSPQTLSITLLDPSTSSSSTFTTPYIDIHYDPSSLTASLLKAYHPSIPSTLGLLSLGLLRPAAAASSSAHTDILLPASALASTRDRTLTLLVDRVGVLYHLAFTSVPTAAAVQSSTPNDMVKGAQGRLEVRVEQMAPGPAPVLNKPVVVREDGRVEGAEPEKTFLQKYWWAIGLFLIIQLLAGGGGGKE